jgi:hypothetical protein
VIHISKLKNEIIKYLEKQNLDLTSFDPENYIKHCIIYSDFISWLPCPLSFGARCRDYVTIFIRNPIGTTCGSCIKNKHGHCSKGHPTVSYKIDIREIMDKHYV